VRWEREAQFALCARAPEAVRMGPVAKVWKWGDSPGPEKKVRMAKPAVDE
jgi:hypothetical protein